MKGKSYNRGIRAHKLAMEALFRLMWDAFVAWHESHHGEYEGCVVNEDAVVEKAQVCRRTITAKGEVRPCMEELQEETLEGSKVNQERIQKCLHSGTIKVTWLNFFCNSSKLKELVIGRCICYVCQQFFRISTPWTGRIMHVGSQCT
jgi:hypothetical protein